MVLTEAFAESTPVVASNIPGYRDVVRDGVEGILVRPGDPSLLADALHRLAADPERRRQMAIAARQRAEKFAWPQVAGEVLSAYEEALAVPPTESATSRPTRRRRSRLGTSGAVSST